MKPSVVFLHGYANDSSIFKELIKALSDRFDCHAIDFPYVKSNEKIYTPSELTDYLETEINRLKLKNIALVGYSNGGKAAILYADRNPLNVRSLHLLGSSPEYRLSPATKLIWKVLKGVVVTKPVLKVYSQFNSSNWVRKQFGATVLSEDKVKLMRENYYSLHGTALLLAMSSQTKQLSNLKMPKYAVLAKDDKGLKYEFYKPILENAGCKVILLDNGGHFASRRDFLAVKNHLFAHV